MKKTITRMLSLVLAVAAMLSVSAMAADTGPTVRVNGHVVDFPDGQPYVDEHDRTMVPVRFVTEAMDAAVDWDDRTQTVTIAKEGTTLTIRIGSPELTVTAGGKSTTVQMDTAAIIRDGRTYIPIRFAAEALGATVDYSDTYGAVGIYGGNLTAAEITRLQAYPYTAPKSAVTYEQGKAAYDTNTLRFYYGDRSGFGTFANAREHLYNTMDRNGTYYLPALGKTLTGSDNDAFFSAVVEEAIAEVSYQSPRLTITFHADESCIYQGDGMDRTTACVRGIAEVTLHAAPTELAGSETAMLCDLGFTQLYADKTMYMDLDVHMNTQPTCNVNIHTIVPLGEAYE